MSVHVRKAVVVVASTCTVFIAASRPALADPVCDLTTQASCSISGFNTGLFYQDEVHPSGTGVIDSFLRLQQKTYEAAYNTSARPINLDAVDGMNAKTDKNFTRNLAIGEVGTTTIGGTAYRSFFLDINEPAARPEKPLITLDQLEIFVSDTASLNKYTNFGSQYQTNKGNNASGTLTSTSGATSKKIFDLDTGTEDNYVQLDYLIQGQGSGSSDMAFYLDDSLFKKADGSYYQYVYLFSQFGDFSNRADKYESQAGFEEWFVRSSGGVPPPNISQVPEPGSLLLLGSGLGFVVRRFRRRTA